MSKLSAVQIQRREELYGPNRCLNREAARKKLTEDHIKENFMGTVHCDNIFQTTNARDYIHTTCHGRNRDSIAIREKHNTPGIELSCRKEVKDYHMKSVTKSTFIPLQCTEPVVPQKPTLEKCHYLENDSLPHPLEVHIASESQDNYTAPITEFFMKVKENRDERINRVKDSKGTHFIYGFSAPQNESEQMAEFKEKKLDPNVFTAGKPDLPTKGYSITEHETGENEVELHVNQGPENLQQMLQARNYIKNINPRDTVNINLRKAFLEYDKDLSGSISKDELKAVCKDMKVDIGDNDLDEIIERCDLNGDGQLDYHEFATNLSRFQPLSSQRKQSFISITTTDFKDPKDQKMSAKQLLAMEKDAKRFEPVETVPTKLLSWAAQEDYLQSITMKDYKEPLCQFEV